MEKRNVQANFQLQDSYVKDFMIHNIKRINNSEEFEVSGQIGFGIKKIDEDKFKYISQIELINDIKVEKNKEEYANIHISMIGLFTATKSKELNKEKFIEMLKLNGATTLSHLIRSYIYAITGLSGMPQITTTMSNFIEFFKESQKEDI